MWVNDIFFVLQKNRLLPAIITCLLHRTTNVYLWESNKNDICHTELQKTPLLAKSNKLINRSFPNNFLSKTKGTIGVFNAG